MSRIFGFAVGFGRGWLVHGHFRRTKVLLPSVQAKTS